MGTASRRSCEDGLDEAIEQTFPASDPIAPGNSTGTEKPGSDPNRKAPVITREQVQDAAAQTEECPACQGRGRIDTGACQRCGGLGRVAVSD